MVCKNVFNSAIGAIVLSLLIYYSIMFLYKKKFIEPMTSVSKTDKDKIKSAVEGNSDRLGDILLTSKYRSNYEDTILSLEKIIGLSILNEVINNAELISKDAISPEAVKAITNINQLTTFKESLNQAMIILDKN